MSQSSIGMPSKKKSIEKQPKNHSNKSKLGTPLVVSQRTSIRIGSKITADGIVEEPPSMIMTMTSPQGSAASLSLPESSSNAFIQEVEFPSHLPSCYPNTLYESTDILSRLGNSNGQQSLPNLPSHNCSNESNSCQQQQQQLQLLKRSSQKQATQNNTPQLKVFAPTDESDRQNGLNFTFMEVEQANQKETHLEDDIAETNHTHARKQRLGEIPPLEKQSSSKNGSVSSSSNSSGNSKGKQQQHQEQVPKYPSGGALNVNRNNMQQLPIPTGSSAASVGGIINSGGSSGKNFSLADSFVVKKSGKYTDDYENAQSSSDSSKDGKKLIMLGRGGFGQVFLIKQKQGAQEERAMKIVPKGFSEAQREVMMLKKFSHPNVLKIYEYFEDDGNIYVITERCYGYNLFDYIILKGQFTESQTCKIADGVLRALAEAHKQGIVHRDVKPDNIMLDFNETRDSFQVKLIDWGLADQLQVTNSNGSSYLSKRCGTLHYLAPEVLMKRYNEKVDLWSLGMVLFTLIQGSPPICGKSQANILEQVQEFTCSFKYSCWKSISDEAKDLILALLERDPNKRISAVDALRHPWFSRLAGTVVVDTQELKSSFTSLVKYSQANTFKKTVLGFFASHLITKRERNRFLDIFQVLDTDKNGELSVEELKAGFSRLFSEEEFQLCHSEIENIFFLSLSATFEGANGIKYEEFLSSMLAHSETYSADSLWQAFKMFDTDKNGKINLDEIIKTLDIPADSEAVASFKQVINSFDENHDGELDFEEFRKVMTNFLELNSQDILSQDIYLS